MGRLDNPLFVGVYPTGIAYADRRTEEHGDYKKLAFLDYRTLRLREYVKPDHDLLPAVREDADAIIAQAGEEFQISTCGQTVTLGQAL